MKNMKNRMRKEIMVALVLTLILATLSPGFCTTKETQVSVRIKDLATIQGSNTNQLIGYGLCTGLKGTGDRTKTVSNAMLKNMLETMGMKIDPSEFKQFQTKNSAVVMVTANLPASFRSGDSIDVTVSSLGDAKSLDGGILLLSTLRGPDGRVYASAQGPISIGLGPGEMPGKSKSVVGRIPAGGLICRDMDINLIRNGQMTWVLRNPDYNTLTRVIEVINKHFHTNLAHANGDRFIVIDIEGNAADPVTLAAQIGDLKIVPDVAARVVVNERTGTVVMGSSVKVLPVIISHGNLTLNVTKTSVKTSGKADKNQKTATVGEGKEEEVRKDFLYKLGGDATVQDVIEVLNYVGAKPTDVITILQALKNSGALQGELEII